MFGVNVICNFRECNGISTLFNHICRILTLIDIPYKTYDILEPEIPHYEINMIVNNAQGWNWTPLDFLKNKYNIGVWSWEIEEFPSIWQNLPYVDEVWTISKFIAKSMKNIRQKVKYFNFYLGNPASVEERELQKFKEDYKIQNGFNFLYIFDVDSFIERKNPFQLINVFKTLKKQYPHINLILKILNSNETIKEQMGGDGITIINDVLSEKTLALLYRSCNAYVSPHKTEGFGYTILEALEYGLYVISTNYGGFKDIVNADNCIFCQGELESIPKHPIYKGHWYTIDDQELYNKMEMVVTKNIDVEKWLPPSNFEKFKHELNRVYSNIENKLLFSKEENYEPCMEFYCLSCRDLLYMDDKTCHDHMTNFAEKEHRCLFYKASK